MPPPTATPAAEVAIDADLVRCLLREQHPDLAALPLTPLDAGWDNAMFRLGTALAVRLPRRAVAAELIRNEQRWLGLLAPRLPLAVPAPVRLGAPGCGFPWHWSVLPWLSGDPADLAPANASQAQPLADFFQALHVPGPADAPVNEFRGVPLAIRRDVVEGRMERLAGVTPWLTDAVREAWDAALAAPTAVASHWVHGDLHARNVLVQDGTITAVIDWGDVCTGDRATDLAAVWMLLDDPDARRMAIEACGPVAPGTWLRGLGWAVSFATVLLETGLADHPRHAAMGRNTLRRITEGPGARELG